MTFIPAKGPTPIVILHGYKLFTRHNIILEKNEMMSNNDIDQ
jgi:hypothetical protein